MVVGVFVASCLGALFAECICGVVFVSGDISPAARCPRLYVSCAFQAWRDFRLNPLEGNEFHYYNP